MWALGEILQAVEPPDQKGMSLTAWLLCPLGERVGARDVWCGLWERYCRQWNPLIRKECL